MMLFRPMLLLGFLTALSMPTSAEPGQIDKEPLMSSIVASLEPHDGVWLRWACGEYAMIFSGTTQPELKGRGTREYLGAGLCGGFILGMMQHADTPKLCPEQLKALPGQVMSHLDKHPEELSRAASAIVAAQLNRMDTCRK